MLQSTHGVNPPGAQGVENAGVRTLFESEENALLRFAFSLVKRRAVAEEIVQDVFLQLHATWAEVDSPRAWLFRSVRNRAFNYLRDNGREAPGDGDESDSGALLDESETVEQMLLRVEATGALQKILADLNETDRRLVELKYFHNLKYREISEQTGLTIGNVGYRLHHILNELAARMRLLGIDEIP